MTKNLIIIKNIKKHLEKVRLSVPETSKQIGISDGGLYSMIKGNRAFSENIIEKILPVLKVSREEFDSWILADAYSKEILEQALKVKKETKKEKGQLILTVKIDSILKQKNMSRTALSKDVKYCQSSINKMITGKLGLSELVKKKIAPVLEVSEDEITSWVVADKYSAKVIELALEENN